MRRSVYDRSLSMRVAYSGIIRNRLSIVIRQVAARLFVQLIRKRSDDVFTLGWWDGCPLLNTSHKIIILYRSTVQIRQVNRRLTIDKPAKSADRRYTKNDKFFSLIMEMCDNKSSKIGANNRDMDQTYYNFILKKNSTSMR